MKPPSVFERYRANIDRALRSALEQHQSPMYDMMRYHLGWMDESGHAAEGSAGKALRPTLCLLSHEAAGGKFERALPAAAAVELVHNFSLIHDDIQDDDKERRHRPTVWSIWGKPQAINVGTAMRAVANLTLLRLSEGDTPVDKLIRAQRLLEESCLRLIEGQYLDISYESRIDVGVLDYLTMIGGKTGSLLACALEMGALLGTDDEGIVQALRTFGWNVGLAFQMRDDLLGIWGSEEKTGKPIGSDIIRKKKSLPIVYALEKTTGSAKAELVALYRGEGIDDTGRDRVLHILGEIEAQAQVQRMVEEYRDRALSALAGVEIVPWALQSLKEVADFLTERES